MPGSAGPARAGGYGQIRGAEDEGELSRPGRLVHERREARAPLGPRHPLFADALRLRAGWRLAEDDPALAGEALRLVNMSLPASAPPAPLLLRARAVLAAGQHPGLVATLYEILAWPRIAERRPIVEEALAIIDEATGSDGVDDTQFADVRRRLQAILERR